MTGNDHTQLTKCCTFGLNNEWQVGVLFNPARLFICKCFLEVCFIWHILFFAELWDREPRNWNDWLHLQIVNFSCCAFAVELGGYSVKAWTEKKSQVFSHEVRAKPKQVDRGYVSASKLTGLADLQQTVQTAQTCERTGAWEEKVEEAVTEGLDYWFQLALPRKTSHLGYSSPPLSHLNVITVRFKPLDTNTQITEL